MVEGSPHGGTRLLALAGSWLVAGGLGVWLYAGSGKLLPHDAALLGTTGPELCQLASCRILALLAHDRVTFAGVVMAAGFLVLWLARRPLARGEPWAFWTLALAGVAGLGACLSYLQPDRLDLLHLWVLPVEAVLYAAGLLLAWRALPRKLGPLSAYREASLRCTDTGPGRELLAFVAGGVAVAGAGLWLLGATRGLLPPSDLDFMKQRLFELRAVNPQLLPLLAHDRCGLGGALCGTGLAVLSIALCGLRAGETDLWTALFSAGLSGFGAAVGIPFAVGYTSPAHLAPAMTGAAACAVALLLLYRPLHRQPLP